jgi:hypothetical protein
MALQINEALTTREGSALVSFYVRLEPLVCINGACIEVEYYHYSSKSAFQAGHNTVVKNVKKSFDYDRATDGTDVIQFAHDSLVTYLTTSQGTDENGDALAPTYDPANVSIVDL